MMESETRWVAAVVEESRRLIEKARAGIDDGRDHIIKSEETIAEAKKILTLAKVR